jgi:hypothetical protein
VKYFLFIIVFTFCSHLFSQTVKFPEHLKKTNIAKLQIGDSLIYYQCHVDSAFQEITTSAGQKIKTKKKKITLTEKFVVHKLDSNYSCKYFTSTITNYPNKKFPFLTLTEVKNWEFEIKKIKSLTIEETLLIAALETKTHSIIHYELNINKTCPNELILMGKNINEQFIIEGNYLLSKILNCL